MRSRKLDTAKVANRVPGCLAPSERDVYRIGSEQMNFKLRQGRDIPLLTELISLSRLFYIHPSQTGLKAAEK